MALVPHGDEKKKLKKALREKDRHDAEAEARVKALCGAEMEAFQAAQKALEDKLKTLKKKKKYCEAVDASEKEARTVKRCMQRAADTFYDAVDDVMSCRTMDCAAKEAEIKRLSERASADLEEVTKEFPSLLRVLQLQALSSGMLRIA